MYYSGSREQWKNIRIEYDNEPLLDASIHYEKGGDPITLIIIIVLSAIVLLLILMIVIIKSGKPKKYIKQVQTVSEDNNTEEL